MDNNALQDAIRLYTKAADHAAFLRYTKEYVEQSPALYQFRVRNSLREVDEFGARLRALSPDPAFQQLVQDAWETGCANGIARAVRAIAEASSDAEQAGR